MRTREKKYSDYGIDDSKKIIAAIRATTATEHRLLLNICHKTVDSMSVADYLYISISQGLSYDNILNNYESQLPISKNDFYAYRRKAIAEFIKLSEEIRP